MYECFLGRKGSRQSDILRVTLYGDSVSEREDRETYRNASRKLDLIIYDFNPIHYVVNI